MNRIFKKELIVILLFIIILSSILSVVAAGEFEGDDGKFIGSTIYKLGFNSFAEEKLSYLRGSSLGGSCTYYDGPNAPCTPEGGSFLFPGGDDLYSWYYYDRMVVTLDSFNVALDKLRREREVAADACESMYTACYEDVKNKYNYGLIFNKEVERYKFQKSFSKKINEDITKRYLTGEREVGALQSIEIAFSGYNQCMSEARETNAQGTSSSRWDDICEDKYQETLMKDFARYRKEELVLFESQVEVKNGNLPGQGIIVPNEQSISAEGQTYTEEQSNPIVERNGVEEFKTDNGEADQNIFQIDSFEGDLSIENPDGSFLPVVSGTKIAEGNTIKTGAKGKIKITTSDEQVVEIGPNSVFQMEDPDTNTLILKAGEIWVKFKNLYLRKYAVKTPYAAISIRGTEFMVKYDPKTQTSTINLIDGELEIINLKNETKSLTAGNSMLIDSSGNVVVNTLSASNWEEEKKEVVISTESLFGTLAIIFMSIVGIGILVGGIFFSKIKQYNKKDSILLGILGLIVSIVSLFCMIFPFIGLPIGILGIIFSRVQKKNKITTISKIGFVVSIIGIVLNGLFLLIYFAYWIFG